MPIEPILDAPTIALVRTAIAVAGGDEPDLRAAMTEAISAGTDPGWMDELLLQSVLMAGYPRALVGFRIWREAGASTAPAEDADSDYARLAEWTTRGEATCREVYGGNYTGLRRNVRELHPALDRWMLVEGYGRTLGRPGLDLKRRELCTVAQTAALRTPHQLHSHLRGALNAGATVAELDAVLELVRPALGGGDWNDVERLWARVRTRWTKGE